LRNSETRQTIELHHFCSIQTPVVYPLDANASMGRKKVAPTVDSVRAAAAACAEQACSVRVPSIDVAHLTSAGSASSAGKQGTRAKDDGGKTKKEKKDKTREPKADEKKKDKKEKKDKQEKKKKECKQSDAVDDDEVPLGAPPIVAPQNTQPVARYRDLAAFMVKVPAGQHALTRASQDSLTVVPPPVAACAVVCSAHCRALDDSVLVSSLRAPLPDDTLISDVCRKGLALPGRALDDSVLVSSLRAPLPDDTLISDVCRKGLALPDRLHHRHSQATETSSSSIPTGAIVDNDYGTARLNELGVDLGGDDGASGAADACDDKSVISLINTSPASQSDADQAHRMDESDDGSALFRSSDGDVDDDAELSLEVYDSRDDDVGEAAPKRHRRHRCQATVDETMPPISAGETSLTSREETHDVADLLRDLGIPGGIGISADRKVRGSASLSELCGMQRIYTPPSIPPQVFLYNSYSF
jgi:hypothetical protein